MPNEKEEKAADSQGKEEKAKKGKAGRAPDQGAPKKKRSKLILLLVILMLLSGSAAGAYFLYGEQILGQYFGNRSAERPQPRKAAAAELKKESHLGPILTLEPFIFNLAKNTSRFAKVSLALGLQSNKSFEEAKKMAPVLRDRALSVLSAKSAEMLIEVSNRDAMKKELFESLKDLFAEKDDLQAVYITDIIIP